MRSKTYIGENAALIRNENSFIEQIKRILMLTFVRLPRAIEEWQIWLAAGIYGLFYVLRSGYVNYLI